jgi:3-deoxy-D-manno-octulosonic-acid transferase
MALIEALDQVRPGLGVIVSTTTTQGHELAQSKLGSRTTCIYFPLDFIFAVHRALGHIRPDLIVCLETELWPNFFGEAHRQGIPTLLLNGRISAGSFRHYRRLQPLMAPLLQGFTAMAMISSEDSKRIVEMGAPASKVVVTGNIKGAGLVEQAEPDRLNGLRQRLDLGSGRPIFVAGSIRDQELVWLPEVFSQLVGEREDLLGVFAPRHLNRLGRLEGWFQRQGLKYQYLSRLLDGSETRKANIIIVDGTGMLFDVYGLADLVFCGGSLVPLGGQNILEPAAWGKAVFYGPHMDNFREACQLLEKAGGGITVEDRDDLLKQLRHYLDHLDELEEMGSRGREALKDRHLIALKQAELIKEVLEHGG